MATISRSGAATWILQFPIATIILYHLMSSGLVISLPGPSRQLSIKLLILKSLRSININKVWYVKKLCINYRRWSWPRFTDDQIIWVKVKFNYTNLTVLIQSHKVFYKIITKSYINLTRFVIFIKLIVLIQLILMEFPSPLFYFSNSVK